MKQPTIMALAILMFVAIPMPLAAQVAVGAAPAGDATAIAARIIKYNFPTCKRVSSATRVADGSIRAKCDGKDYLVFTMFNPKEGKTLELALNCTAAKSLLNVSC